MLFLFFFSQNGLCPGKTKECQMSIRVGAGGKSGKNEHNEKRKEKIHNGVQQDKLTGMRDDKKEELVRE